MFQVFQPSNQDIASCAEVYLSAYRSKPWNETFDKTTIENYILSYCHSDTMKCFAAAIDHTIIGIALALLVPSIHTPYLRIEDFCIELESQRKGYGTLFIHSFLKEAKKLGCDSVLLNTQRNFPSHKFYLKNGFSEIESVLLYSKIK